MKSARIAAGNTRRTLLELEPIIETSSPSDFEDITGSDGRQTLARHNALSLGRRQHSGLSCAFPEPCLSVLAGTRVARGRDAKGKKMAAWNVAFSRVRESKTLCHEYRPSKTAG